MNYKLLEACCLCGHRCGINRVKGQGASSKGKCGAGLTPIVSAYCLHHGEEPMISGRRGSGTIFFANCCLKCVYCQNYNISQREGEGGGGSRREEQGVAGIMLELQARGAHNINLVSPTHYAPPIADAIRSAKQQGLKLPIVYNTGGYDSLELLRELDGLIDIYLPDFKYFSAGPARKYSGAGNYPEVARVGIAEMFRQVGNIKLNDEGVATSGLLVRHLVLPNNLAGTGEVLAWLAALSPDSWISLMAQYSPRHRAEEFPELNRRLSPEEYQQAVAQAEALGLRKVYVQELESSEKFIPDFEKENPFTC